MLRSQASLFILAMKNYIDMGAMGFASNGLRLYLHLVLLHRGSSMYQTHGRMVYFYHLDVPH